MIVKHNVDNRIKLGFRQIAQIFELKDIFIMIRGKKFIFFAVFS